MELIHIPLDRLEIGGQNVRKAPPDPERLAELAASIEAHGLLEPLLVSGSAEGAMVVGGGRRLAAMQQLAADGKWRADSPVGCILVSNGAPADTAESFAMASRNAELSMAENSGHEELHPVDQAVAFRRLKDDGLTDADLSARFGVSPRTVQRRLRMAAAAPELLAKGRTGELSLGTLEAVTVEPDPDKQVAAVAAARSGYGSREWSVKQALLRDKAAANSPEAEFVGLEAYEAAGGTCTRDLFARDEASGVHLDDPALLRSLAEAKLAAAAEAERAKGWERVECSIGHPEIWSIRRDHDAPIDAATPRKLKKDQRERATVYLYIDYLGELGRNVVVAQATSEPATAASGKPKSLFSAALLADLATMRLSIARAKLAEGPEDLARDLLIFQLASQLYRRLHQSGIAVDGRMHRDALVGSEVMPRCVADADAHLSDIEAGLLVWMDAADGGDADCADKRFAALRAMMNDDRDRLLACCVARMLEVCSDGGHFADRAMRELKIDWQREFDPGIAVFGRLSKIHMLKIAEEHLPAEDRDMNALKRLKKGELAEFMTQAFATYREREGRSPWIPEEVFG